MSLRILFYLKKNFLKLTSTLFDELILKLNKFPKCADVDVDDEGNADDDADDDVANNGIIFFI